MGEVGAGNECKFEVAFHCIVMNYQCHGARHVIVTCGSKCHLVFCV